MAAEISEALNAYWANPLDLDECDDARSHIENALGNGFWTFESHAEDSGEDIIGGSAEVGGTLLGIRKSVGEGTYGDFVMFRVAIHEGMHLAGESGEEWPENVEILCRPFH